MAVGTNPVLKAKLIEENRWVDFVAFRESMRKGGNGPAAAQRQAERAFGNPAFRFLTQSETGKPVATVVKATPEGKQKEEEITPTSRLCVKSEFEGKTSVPAEILLWVSRNTLISDVTKEDCPDPAAWGLLMACRGSPSFLIDFWKTMFTKTIPSKISEEKADEDEGGGPEVDLCDELLSASKPDEDRLS